MLNKSNVICFLATKNPDEARKFYQETLGFQLISEDQFVIVFDMNRIMVRIQKLEQFDPPEHTVLGWNVEDIHREVVELKRRGVRFTRYQWLEQDDQGIWTAPGGARVAWFKDPDGNVLSLTQFR